MKEETIHIRYFAQLREQADKSLESISLLPAETPSLIYDRLTVLYGFSLPFTAMRVAVNDEFVPANYCLKNGDHLAFIPPVSGG
jgi:molybdopterin converting factor subunit 1